MSVLIVVRLENEDVMFKHPLEIRLKAMELCKKRSSVCEVAREMDINVSTIRHWIGIFHKGDFIVPPFGKKTPDFRELLKKFNSLKKELAKVQLQLKIFKKAKEYLLKEPSEKYLFIVKYKSVFSVSDMCKIFKINEAAYYKWLKKPIPKKIVYRKIMKNEVKRVFYEHKGRYGSRRIAFELQAMGFKISQVTVSNYMRMMELKVNDFKRYVVTTNSRHPFPIPENKLVQNFKVSRYNEVWVSDITYIRIYSKLKNFNFKII